MAGQFRTLLYGYVPNVKWVTYAGLPKYKEKEKGFCVQEMAWFKFGWPKVYAQGAVLRLV